MVESDLSFGALRQEHHLFRTQLISYATQTGICSKPVYNLLLQIDCHGFSITDVHQLKAANTM
jgi:hypothetical protein